MTDFAGGGGHSSAPARPTRYVVADLDFGIRAENPELAALLDHILGAFRAVGDPHDWYSFHPGDGSSHVVQRNGTQILRMSDHHLVGVFLWHLNQRVMLETRSALTVHAGVVSSGDRALVFPGDANAGKSTLVAALVTAGFDYLSDEAALLDLEGTLVHPYHRSVSLEPGSWPLLPGLRPAPPAGFPAPSDLWILPPDELRDSCLGAACPPGWVLFPRLAVGDGTSLQPVSRADALRRLARRSTNLAALGTPGFRSLVRTVEASSCWEIALDGVRTAVEELQRLVTDRGSDP